MSKILLLIVYATIPNVFAAKCFKDLGSVLQTARMGGVHDKTKSHKPRLRGLTIHQIDPGSFYEKIGLQVDDLIFEVNGKPFIYENFMKLYDLDDGREVELKVDRDSKTVVLKFKCPYH